MSPSSLPPSVFGLPDHPGASGKSDWFNLLAGIAAPNSAPPVPTPTPADSKPVRILARRIVDQPQPSISDTSVPAPPLDAFDDANFSGGLLGRLAALAGIDPRDPTHTPPPLDDQLSGFNRDDPMQPWFARRQR